MPRPELTVIVPIGETASVAVAAAAYDKQVVVAGESSTDGTAAAITGGADRRVQRLKGLRPRASPTLRRGAAPSCRGWPPVAIPAPSR